MCHPETSHLVLWSWNDVGLGCILELQSSEESLHASGSIELHSVDGTLVTTSLPASSGVVSVLKLFKVARNIVNPCPLLQFLNIFSWVIVASWRTYKGWGPASSSAFSNFMTSSKCNKMHYVVGPMKCIFPVCSSPSFLKDRVLCVTWGSLDE